MKKIDYVIWQEGDYFVSQCLNVNVASCGDTEEEARSNIIEAVELYFESEPEETLVELSHVVIGHAEIHA